MSTTGMTFGPILKEFFPQAPLVGEPAGAENMNRAEVF